MVHRPRARAAATTAALMLAAAALSSCGFDYATDRVNTISAGVNNRDGLVDVLGAVVIAGEDNRGVFAATLVNQVVPEVTEPTPAPQVLTNFEGGTKGGLTVIAPDTPVEPIAVAPDSAVNLFATGGIPVEGTFAAGDFVDVVLTFSDGQRTEMSVQVVTPCHQYSPDKLTAITLPADDVEQGEGGITLEEDADESTDPYSCTPIPGEHNEEEH
ncbi:hypothetical protein [Nocardioides sp. R-C-SC26]|uniref:hypothetical protein n=1 Tax=Nocardioides sp. R-C-SC26 TaxID=2870414 RepID=UPI001E2CF4F3|nr:hypothetical protein [Nocardioides sp. R-C-SC26]